MIVLQPSQKYLNLKSFPEEILLPIFENIMPDDLKNCKSVCKRFLNIIDFYEQKDYSKFFEGKGVVTKFPQFIGTSFRDLKIHVTAQHILNKGIFESIIKNLIQKVSDKLFKSQVFHLIDEEDKCVDNEGKINEKAVFFLDLHCVTLLEKYGFSSCFANTFAKAYLEQKNSEIITKGCYFFSGMFEKNWLSLVPCSEAMYKSLFEAFITVSINFEKEKIINDPNYLNVLKSDVNNSMLTKEQLNSISDLSSLSYTIGKMNSKPLVDPKKEKIIKDSNHHLDVLKSGLKNFNNLTEEQQDAVLSSIIYSYPLTDLEKENIHKDSNFLDFLKSKIKLQLKESTDDQLVTILHFFISKIDQRNNELLFEPFNLFEKKIKDEYFKAMTEMIKEFENSK